MEVPDVELSFPEPPMPVVGLFPLLRCLGRSPHRWRGRFLLCFTAAHRLPKTSPWPNQAVTTCLEALS